CARDSLGPYFDYW
nr:immunoglobulin heavy chain junction region [Mus musculus]NSM06938.1 immunoglobulin heavy chain junction region [Mus musculus]